ncbi:calcium-dependent protein kinase 13 isoform X2 [Physcomitrium patens]|uniref:calcium-dependent protein kinase 13 isoform X2 n=1 Tax=Physcomitrium patens TaxID=3218 RepID=UPI000D15B606|nr:calcium-dependent protein kinase 1-like isoform X2 [Physcomitrium patens]|eukprot:XP_024380921.1 calcium-dependent protein kinase 1-like isoform X2 [Physcomitrella patens]
MANVACLIGSREHLPLPVLLQNTRDNFEQIYSVGQKLGAGQFGTPYLYTKRATGLEYASKCIPKRKLISLEEIEDVGREVEVMYHLSGHPNIVSVMEACHNSGVVDQDLKPENFLFKTMNDYFVLKAADFGSARLFEPGDVFSERAQGILERKMEGVPPVFTANPWPNIFEGAKDLTRMMLNPDLKQRLNAHEILEHSCIREDGGTLKKQVTSLVQFRMNQFALLNKLKKLAIWIITETLSLEEITTLKEVFTDMDSYNDGAISFEELKAGLLRMGTSLKDTEIFDLMDTWHVDHDGIVDFKKFVAATLSLNQIELEERCRPRWYYIMAALQHLDKSGSRYITTDELLAVYFEFHMGDLRFEYLLHDVSIDADGCIDYKTFLSKLGGGNGGMGHQNVRCIPGITNVLSLENIVYRV